MHMWSGVNLSTVRKQEDASGSKNVTFARGSDRTFLRIVDFRWLNHQNTNAKSLFRPAVGLIVV